MSDTRPPAGDEPLDDIEQALVRALVAIIAEALRADAAQALTAIRDRTDADDPKRRAG
jgi:hypothetical protein